MTVSIVHNVTIVAAISTHDYQQILAFEFFTEQHQFCV